MEAATFCAPVAKVIANSPTAPPVHHFRSFAKRAGTPGKAIKKNLPKEA